MARGLLRNQEKPEHVEIEMLVEVLGRDAIQRREFVEARILGGLRENDEFDSGCGHALRFEQQVAEVLIPAAAA